jgi:phosphate-selective porin OprO and OprP
MKHSRRLTVIVAVLIAGVLAGPPTRAQQATNIEDRLNQLEQEIRILKRQKELDQEAAQQKAKETPIITAGKDGFALKSPDGNFVLNLKGQLQVDSRWYLDDQDHNGADEFLVRRARPILEGTLFKEFDFRLMPDFGNSQVVLYDAYVEWRHWDALKLRAGKFKSPVGLELLQDDSWTTFTERSLVTDLVPNRDVGVDFNGNLLNGVVGYAAGVFNGTADGSNGDLDNNDAKDYEGRIFIQPFKTTNIEPLQGLGFGVAGTVGDESGSASSPNLPSFKTTGQLTFFKYLQGTSATVTNTTVANGQHTRVTPQGYYYWGPLGLMAEYALSDQEVERRPGGVVTRDHIRNTAWQVTASWVLTGENASFNGVTPKRPFDLKAGTWGAFQLVARYSDLHVDPSAFPTYADPSKSAQEAYDWGVGLNWYLNRNIKLALDYDQTSFDGGAGTATNVKNREIERFLGTRAQLWF